MDNKNQYIEELESRIRELESQLEFQSLCKNFLHRLIFPLLCIGQDYRIIAMNQSFQEAFGFREEKLLNKPVTFVFGKKAFNRSVKSCIDLSFKSEVVSSISLVKDYKGINHNTTVDCLPVLSEQRTINHIVLLFKKMPGSGSSFTAYSVKHSEWEKLFNAFGEILFITDNEYNIKYLNKKGQKELNLKNKDVIGRKCYEVIYSIGSPHGKCPSRGSIKQDVPGSYEKYTTFTEEGYVINAIPIRKKDGSVYSILHQMQPSETMGKDSVREITSGVTIERRLHEEFHDFRKRLGTEYPQLTAHNLTHCTLIRMNLTTEEVARYFNVSPSSIQRARVRLKKKLNLTRKDDLIRFLLNY
jgi:transcriptional regulator with PAS, ATPase and Fis domain/DNA-binding CsgD family transcriptional regulator